MAIPDAEILAVQFFTMAVWYILQQNCLKKWTGSAVLGSQWYNF